MTFFGLLDAAQDRKLRNECPAQVFGFRPTWRFVRSVVVLFAFCAANGCAGSKEASDDADDEAVYLSTCPANVQGCASYNECETCDASCGDYCQGTSVNCGPAHCMTCRAGDKLVKWYTDGAGFCVPGDGSYLGTGCDADCNGDLCELEVGGSPEALAKWGCDSGMCGGLAEDTRGNDIPQRCTAECANDDDCAGGAVPMRCLGACPNGTSGAFLGLCWDEPAYAYLMVGCGAP